VAPASCLLDTNILLRISRRTDPEYATAYGALAKLESAGAALHYTHQNIAEFWNVMTRPVARNGFGLTAAEAEREVQTIEQGMRFLPESDATYREWRRLILLYKVSALRFMMLDLQRRCWSMASGDFARYAGIVAMHPKTIALSESP